MRIGESVRRGVFFAPVSSAALRAAGKGGTPRLPWGDPDLEGTWTNATLTLLQRPAELGAKAFLTPEEAAAWEKQRIQQTDADRPARPGEVGAYNDAFFERGKGGVKSRRTSLVIDPPDGRIPALTAPAQQKVDARQRREAASPADSPEDRWLTERCILFGATVPMLPEPYNNNYAILQTPGYVVIRVEMNHDTRTFRSTGVRRCRAACNSGPAIRAATGKAARSSSKPAT